MINLHYVILTHNEKQVFSLLNKIEDNQNDVYNLHIVDDYSEESYVKAIKQRLDRLKGIEARHFHQHKLEKDFAAHRNWVHNKIPEYDWIMMLDADEYVDDKFFTKINGLLNLIVSQNIELVFLPRKNTVEGITQEYIEKHNWSVNEQGLVNYPDLQGRLYINRKSVKWQGRVHERVHGALYSTRVMYDWAHIYHPKTFERQKKQNEFYNEI